MNLKVDHRNRPHDQKGKIYNITRSATATTLSELKTAIDAGKNCYCYTGWEVNSAGAIAASSVSGTKIGYVAYVSTSDVDAGVSGSRILVLANADAGTSILWGSYGTSRGLTADDLNGYSKKIMGSVLLITYQGK